MLDRHPSGINLEQTNIYVDKVFNITPQLANLLHFDINQRYSFIDVTVQMLNYIKRNNLRRDGRLIIPNPSLNELFHVIEPFTYTDLHYHLRNQLSI